jgi:hypothetical protein
MGGGRGSARPQAGGWLGAAGALEGRNIVRVHVVVPGGFDNPGQPTGGNIYDRRVCSGLAVAGWDVPVTTIASAWTRGQVLTRYAIPPHRVHVARPGDERHRDRLRAGARQRRSSLRGWEQTTQEMANALTAHGCRNPVPPGVGQPP